MRALLILLLAIAAVQAEDRPRLQVPFVTSTSPWPSEDAWNEAAKIPSLAAPLNTASNAETQQTEVRLLWNAEFLFVRFHCAGKDPVTLPDADSAAERPLHVADCVEIFLDPVGDGRVFAEFQFDARGRIFDGLHLYSSEPRTGVNYAVQEDIIRRDAWFFPEWRLEGIRAEARSTERSWDVTVALPAKPLLKRLGRSTWAADQVIRANFLRLSYPAAGREPAFANWAPVIAGRAHRSPASMGYLTLAPAKP